MYWIVFIFLILLTNPSYRVDKEVDVLFVGNSLTYMNDLPSLVKELVEKDGKTFKSTNFLFPDYSLEDHWNQGKVQDEIEKGVYEFVIMQQGPSAAPESQVLLLEYTRRFAEVCRKSKTTLALYMVWPSKARSFDHDNVIKSYTNAATKTSSLLCPAGLAWKYAWHDDAGLTLYAEDNFHPSLKGSVLASLSIHGTLFNKRIDTIHYDKLSWSNTISKSEWNVFIDAVKNAARKE